MADISLIVLPDGTSYNIEDIFARQNIPSSASINENGLITFTNFNSTILFTIQLPLYNGSVT